MKEIIHQKDKLVATMNGNFKAKMSEQERRFDAEIQLIRHENKAREGTIIQEHEQREHDLTEQIKVRDRKLKQTEEIKQTTEIIEKLFPSGIHIKTN